MLTYDSLGSHGHGTMFHILSGKYRQGVTKKFPDSITYCPCEKVKRKSPENEKPILIIQKH